MSDLAHKNVDDEPCLLPTAEAQQRLTRYMDAAAAAAVAGISPTEFAGMLLLSFLVYGEDWMLDEAIGDAMRTISGGAS